MTLSIVSRKEWHAKSPRSVTRRAPSELAGVAIHWFGKPSAAKSHDGCAALLRGVQRDHMAPGGLGATGGANDIGYNHAVCPHGVAFDLRGFGVQTGANGDAKSNREYAAIVYMAGTGDKPTAEALAVLTELIRMWQAKGAGPLVKPHRFFTDTECPGPDLLKWVDLEPPPWSSEGPNSPVAVEDETPPWLIEFIVWRVAQDADPKLRPKHLPKRIPESAWEAVARMDRIANLMGPQQAFLDWVEWRRRGAKNQERPRSLPETIPQPWKDALTRLEQIFTAEKATRPAEKTAVTAKTKLLARPRSTPKALESYLLGRKHGTYSDDDVRAILASYTATAKAAGLDPLLIVSQLVLETGNLTSQWSQPPRRNPAGIGVTGKPGAGVSFPSWDKAVHAHVGRLLAYAIPKGQENAAQGALIEEALAVRALPDSRRGCAPTLEGLAGTWAADQTYAEKIARLANEISKVAK